MIRKASLALVPILALGGCIPSDTAPAPTPAPVPARVAVPAPTPAPPPGPVPGSDWNDWAVAPGSWTYRQAGAGSIATFGTANAVSFALSCQRPGGNVIISRADARDAQALTLRATAGEQTLPASSASVAGAAGSAASVSPYDDILDKIAFSRGSFAVEGGSSAPIRIPAWPEMARVIEDCRRTG